MARKWTATPSSGSATASSRTRSGSARPTGLKFKGGGEARDFASIPLGYELKAKGTRQRRRDAARPRGRGEAQRLRDVRGRDPVGHRPGRGAGAREGSLHRGRRQEGDERRQAHREGAAGRPRPAHRRHPPAALPPPRGRAHLRDREQGVERLRHGQLLHLRVHGAPRRHGRRRGGDRARPRARARDPRALPQGVQAGHVGPAASPSAPWARRARSTTTRSRRSSASPSWPGPRP